MSQELIADFREFAALLNRHAVKYVVLGGYAVGWHGHPRATKGIDFFVERSPENAARIAAVLEAFGMRCLGITVADLLEENTCVYFGIPPQRIDVINYAEGITFEEAWQTRELGTHSGVELNWISREPLLRNKRAASRPQDIADVQTLERRPPKKAG